MAKTNREDSDASSSDKPKKRNHRQSKRPSTELLPPNAASWPLVRAYAPVPDVWRATGLGTAAVVRRRPDGLLASAFFTIVLLEHGLQVAFGKPDATPEETEELLSKLRDQIPPMQESTIEETALYAWGAFAISELEGHGFLPEVREQNLVLLPKPRGSMVELRDALIGPGGPTPPGLAKIIAANATTEDTPEGQEVVIFTEMTFDLADAQSAVSRLRRASPAFLHEEDGHTFAWTRAYPKGHWSPLKALGNRQVLGSVRISGDELVAEAKTLSMAARLAATLRDMLGETIKLRETRWRDALALPRGAKT